ncbi:hypothetical protein PFICI_01915 [Pestalotiopsis fici W106-1]|uniref:Uncharacterized protein n=1 Tax=Pestalotiopsis fici (strain W106-1 / CGMCC3.15140) TaxID=1229662 RepID=W3XRE7_PESFW|nr:uncharacterized protein PFICI_01915 [Pestalotiopsis fici W106-1]ETS88087.1 hypothetical protein PFICI_01915 [Pestalotiopsis fici W106-1]
MATLGPLKKVDSDDWLKRLETDMPGRPDILEALGELAKRGEKGAGMKENVLQAPTGGRRGLRTVPFERKTFEKVSRAFNMHSSISRAISRADVPVFSHVNATTEDIADQYKVEHNTFVYNCRTSNAWQMDLGLTVTYFPDCELSFAVLFGCHISTEEEIIKRLAHARDDISHPLLLPGIVAEIERKRHFYHADRTIDEIEARIFDLETRPDAQDGMDAAEMAKIHKEKRTAWLNTTYTRNCLISWQVQLENMVRQTEALDPVIKMGGDGSSGEHKWPGVHGEVATPMHQDEMSCDHTQRYPDATADSPTTTLVAHDEYQEKRKATGYKIASRIRALIEEYDDKIRDCTMRIDGMAMATQWAQGETNLEIAKATSRDSRHMRSIALVTMVFLPGTFFAGMFSMTFFNWSNDGGEPIVSEYFWVYVVVTVACTLLTVGLWYYFNISRRSLRKSRDVEEMYGS